LGSALSFGQHRDGHGIFREEIHTDDVVRRELDGIDGDETTVDIEHEPVVRIDIELEGIA